MPLNQKDQRIRKLYERGERDLARIARKIGYGDSVIQEGILRVQEGLERIKNENNSI